MTFLEPARKRGPRVLRWAVGCAVVMMPMVVSAQTLIRPARPPIVDAEHERWYIEGNAITFSGSVYYPTGATVFFNPYEMVRSGDYRGIPLFTMKTSNPYDTVYLPVAGGLLKPYERRRDGDVAGTVGNSAPSFPVGRDNDAKDWYDVPRAGGPPMFVNGAPTYVSGDGVAYERRERRPPAFAGEPEPAAPASTVDTPLASALRPTGLNAFYVDYEGRRWFSSGPVVLLQPSSFTRAADYHGFAVYVTQGDQDETIYITVADVAGGLLTPYSIRK